MDLATIGISILCSIIASLVIFVSFYMWRPKINVSEKLSRNDGLIIVKFVNETKYTIHDVSYEMLGCHKNLGGIVDVSTFKPAKPKISIVNKFDKNDEEAKYAIRISYNDKENNITHWLEEDEINNYLLFNITIKHSFSGGITTVSKQYFIRDIIDGKFETKTSLTII